MSRVVAFVCTLFVALEVVAHPGHPTLNPDHSHGMLDVDPMLGLALFAGVSAAFLFGKALYRRVAERR